MDTAQKSYVRNEFLKDAYLLIKKKHFLTYVLYEDNFPYFVHQCIEYLTG